MIQDILGRLKNLRLNIVNSPDFNTYATKQSKEIIDQVLQTFIAVNRGVTSSSGSNTTFNVLDKFSLNGSNSIKNRLQIINEKNNIITMIKISPELSSEIKRWSITKINMINGIR